MYIIGWLSTGGKVSRDLLEATMRVIRKGEVPAKIAFVFCNREKEESKESKRFLDFAYDHEALPIAAISSTKFKLASRENGLKNWHQKYDQQVIKYLKERELMPVDLMVLAGYKLIVSAWLCQRYSMINLHPALPGGPVGTWQEVIWQLIDKRAAETGAKMHLVTPELDQGPAITYCTFPIKGEPFDRYWAEIEGKSIEEIKTSEGESSPLFQLIRQQGVVREPLLIIETLKLLATQEVKIKGERILTKKNQPLKQGYDLTPLIDQKIESRF